MCDGKHTRTKVMNLNNQSDYSEPFWTTGSQKKTAKSKKLEKRRQNEIQPQSTRTFVSGLHKQMGSVTLAVL